LNHKLLIPEVGCSGKVKLLIRIPERRVVDKKREEITPN
jgi:hypothetical protein